MDFIFIRELRLEAWVGIYKHEKIAPQTIEFDIEMALPGDTVFRTRKVADTIDYAIVVARIDALLKAERFGLVETLADRLAKLLLDEFPSPRVRLTVTKLGVLRGAKRVGVSIERTRDPLQ
ncbi:MAG: dihydroneopterin aldolase [Betaproteobacteria bacterium]|nr:dihydroneopterin aldolase [Betaproteobacteria bacterium]